MRNSVFFTSALLFIYCVSASLLPSYVKESTIMAPQTELIIKLETEIEKADEETLRNLTKMMLANLKAETSESNKIQHSTIEMYSSFDSILVGLLILHFASLIGYMKARGKV